MKSKNKIILGIDTSCYTTSIAAINLNGELMLSRKSAIKVRAGQKGVRQSEGVFQHINNLGELFGNLSAEIGDSEIVAVCASSRPRPVDGSYMPVFSPGYRFAQSIAGITGASLYATSHQEGHIRAAKWDSGLDADSFVSIHLSGGTSEILLVSSKTSGYDVEIVGGTRDISAGQLLDRIGVRLGYDFPCGRRIDENSLEFDGETTKLKISHDKGYINLSGIETAIYKIIDSAGNSRSIEKQVSYMAMEAICTKLYRALLHTAKSRGCSDVLFAGGVSSSRFLSSRLSDMLKVEGIRTYWCRPEYAQDNAVGAALIGYDTYNNKHGDESDETEGSFGKPRQFVYKKADKQRSHTLQHKSKGRDIQL